MSDEQFRFNFDRKHKRPPKPKDLPKPEPPPRSSLLRRCWEFLCGSLLVPLASFALSCVPQIFRNTVSAIGASVLVPMIATAIHYHKAPPVQPPPQIELQRPELPKAEPAKKEPHKVEPPKAEPGLAEKNPWEATVKPE